MNTPATPIKAAIVLLAHGSRDPQWSAPIEAVALRARDMDKHATVCCAYLEHTEPSLNTCVADLHARGYTDIHILPLQASRPLSPNCSPIWPCRAQAIKLKEIIKASDINKTP